MSFVVRHDGRYLHHNFVVALLNDLFGIQSRGGCSCAGPYGHRLLGIDIETSHEFEREIARGCEGIKPGWIRVNFNYFISEAVFEFLLDAVDVVASDGWRFLHHNFVVALLNDLFGIQSRGGCSCAGPYGHRLLGIDLETSHEFEREITGGCEGIKPGWVRVNFNYFLSDTVADYLAEARRLADAAPPRVDRPSLDVGPDFEHLRWFWLPEEVEQELVGRA